MMNNRERPYARHPGSYKDHSNFDGYRNNDEYLNDEYDLDDDDLYTYSGRRQDEEEYEDNMEPDDYNWYEDTDDYNDEYDNTYRRDELTGQMGGETRRARSTVTKSRTRTKGKKRDAVSWVVSVGLAVVAALLIRAFVFEIILVEGASMYPTLLSGERVAVEKITRYSGMPKRGDIIIVEYPKLPGTYVKRAIGLPGETVEVRDSVVYINDRPLFETYTNPEPYTDMAPVVVPEDHVFVMGDNRARSLDSRQPHIGAIAHDAIVGHGLFVIWPLNNIHNIS